MNNFFRAIIAGYGAKKLGGGCFGTILVFILIWVALGQCSFSSREVPPPETYPANGRATVNWDLPYTISMIFERELVSEEIIPDGEPERTSTKGVLADFCKYPARRIYPRNIAGALF
ncbi:MAG: hypothetical protein WEB30_16225 [Cyclobacteriaceae bacterium]